MESKTEHDNADVTRLEKELARAEFEIAQLKAQVALHNAYFQMAEEAKHILRNLGMGVTGSDILETSKITADYIQKNEGLRFQDFEAGWFGMLRTLGEGASYCYQEGLMDEAFAEYLKKQNGS